MADQTKMIPITLEECAVVAAAVMGEGWESAAKTQQFDAIRTARSVLRLLAVDGVDPAKLTQTETEYAKQWDLYITGRGATFSKRLTQSGEYEPVEVVTVAAAPASANAAPVAPPAPDETEAPKGKKK